MPIPPDLLSTMQAGARRLRRESGSDRIGRLKRLRKALGNHRNAIHAALRQDLGKSAEATDLTEIAPVLWEIGHAIRHVRRWMRPRAVGTPVVFTGTSSHIQYDPKGATLIIAPWNYPITLTLGPLVSAIAAGCTAVIKPSEFTPATAAAVEALVTDLFEPDEVCVIQGEADTSQALLAMPFDHIYFTGSPRVGRLVMKAAAENLTTVTLELGGKSPTLVDTSADMDLAARRIVFGKFSNAGQTCIAPDYVLVPRSRMGALETALRAALRDFYPDASSADYTSIISDRHRDRLLAMRDEADSEGATVTTHAVEGEGRLISPTILTGAPDKAALMQEEIFGPLLPLIPYDDLSEAIDHINDGTPPLALYIFSGDDRVTDRVLRETQSGGVVINDTLIQFAHPELPFGGIRDSGIGRGHGHWGFLEFTNQRAVVRQRWKRSPIALFHPPMTEFKRKLVRLLLKLYG